MGSYSGPDASESDLLLSYDFGNTEKSFGTTNLIANISLFIYNNVPSHVTASLTQTSDSYRGSPIWQLSLTPTTATGVSYLTAGNNPGIGVYHGGGGGDAGVYTGHSIFFKPTVAMHSAPIFTNYSNIAGWQSGANYDDMGDSWYRANVVWYDTVTRSDAKYWAINPASATLNVPIITYWAAPFKEAQNYNNIVSPYTSSTRGSGSGIVNLVNPTSTGGSIKNGASYNSSNGGFILFDGTNDGIELSGSNLSPNQMTISSWNYSTNYAHNGFMFEKTTNGSVNTQYSLFFNSDNTIYYRTYGLSTTDLAVNSSTAGVVNNQWNNVVATWDGTNKKIYVNGILAATSASLTGIVTQNTVGAAYIGVYGSFGGYFFNGRIAQTQIYNRALSAAEIQQNFNASKSKFGR